MFSPESAAQSIARALVWPFSLSAGMFILFAGTGVALAGLMMRSLGLIGLVPGAILLTLLATGIARYLFLVMEATALGHRDAPLLSINHFNLADDFRFTLILAWVALALGSGSFANPAIIAGLSVASLVLVPAAFIQLAISGSVFAALDPRRLLGFIKRLGMPYLGMMAAAFLILLGLAIGLIGQPVFLAEILGLYLLVVAFNLLGRLAYAHRGRLGFRPEKSPEAEEERRNKESEKALQAVLDRIHPLSKINEFQQALAAVESAVEEMDAGQEVIEAMTARLLEWENPEVGLLYLQKRVTRALACGSTETAWDLCQQGLSVTNRFHPQTGDEAILLARHGLETGAHRKAVQVLMGFEDRYPQLPDLLPTAALLEAKAVAEKLGRPEVARGRLRQLSQKYSACADSPELNAYLTVLEEQG